MMKISILKKDHENDLEEIQAFITFLEYNAKKLGFEFEKTMELIEITDEAIITKYYEDNRISAYEKTFEEVLSHFWDVMPENIFYDLTKDYIKPHRFKASVR